jgi:DNA primase
LVRDIVESIARVPDPFKRAFYIKECARIMELEEEVLITETNKVVKRILQKREVDRQRKTKTQVNIVPDDGSWPSDVPPPDAEDQAPPFAPLPKKEVLQDEFQEREIARLLISFGGKIFDKEQEVTVAEYILGNIEEVLDDFDNKQYESIIKECLERVLAKSDLSPQYFISHSDHKLSALAVDLLHSPYEYSDGWEKRELYMHSQKMPDENFTKDSMSALLRFKLKKVMKLSEKNQQKLKGLSPNDDITQIMRLLKVQTKLNEMRNELADELGTVILK